MPTRKRITASLRDHPAYILAVTALALSVLITAATCPRAPKVTAKATVVMKTIALEAGENSSPAEQILSWLQSSASEQLLHDLWQDSPESHEVDPVAINLTARNPGKITKDLKVRADEYYADTQTVDILLDGTTSETVQTLQFLVEQLVIQFQQTVPLAADLAAIELGPDQLELEQELQCLLQQRDELLAAVQQANSAFEVSSATKNTTVAEVNSGESRDDSSPISAEGNPMPSGQRPRVLARLGRQDLDENHADSSEIRSIDSSSEPNKESQELFSSHSHDEIAPGAVTPRVGRHPTESNSLQPSQLPEVYERNPRWIVVSESLNRARKKRDELLRVYTDRHPSVIAASRRVTQLEQELTQIPELLGMTPVEFTPGYGPADQPTATETPVPHQELPLFSLAEATREMVPIEDVAVQTAPVDDQVVRDHKKSPNESPEVDSGSVGMAQGLQELDQQISQLRQRLKALHGNPLPAISSSADAKIWLVEPAQLTQAISSTTANVRDLFAYLMPALVVAIGIASLREPAVDQHILASMDDVEDVFRGQTEFVATIPMSGNIPAANDTLTRPTDIARIFRMAAETTCVVTCLLMAWAIWQIPEFVDLSLNHPISAFLTAIDEVCYFFGTFSRVP